MERRKLTKEDIDKVRDIEGFPIGSDEDIIALSDAPYYTACPNPFIEDFIKEYGKPYDEATDDYHREPFATDVSEGKSDPIYNAHSYHTKVPYKAIMRYILHYTNPGDIVFDGFCGTGMTGVAARMCVNEKVNNAGIRYAILNDLAPIASFIAHHFNKSTDVSKLYDEGMKIIRKAEDNVGWMYEAKHDGDKTLFNSIGTINYTIWSDVLLCPECGEEIVFGDVAVDFNHREIKDNFKCPNCLSLLTKKKCHRAKHIFYDDAIGKTRTMAKISPIRINYNYNGRSYNRKPENADFKLIEKIESCKYNKWYSTSRMCEGKESRRNDKFGITNVHDFCTKRNNIILAELYSLINESGYKDELLFVLTASLQRANKTNRFRFGGTGNLSGTLYIPSLQFERNVLLLFKGKLEDIIKQKKLIPQIESTIIS